jgi:hypothetical protein
VIEWYCERCKHSRIGEVCGNCGSACKVANQDEKHACQNCGSTSLGDPVTLLKSLSSEFYTIISKVNEVQPELAELYRSFDFFVTLVRLCRLAGVLGFPQIEDQVMKCARGLTLINDKALHQLSKVRKEALFDLRRIDYFRNVELEHYRNAETILQSTSNSIIQITELMRHWIAEVKIEIAVLRELALPLRQHYELLSQVSHLLPDDLYTVAAIIPPIEMAVKTDRVALKTEAYLVFGEEYFLFIPRNVKKLKQNGAVNKIKYQTILNIKPKHSILKGSQLRLTLQQGVIRISAPPKVIDIIHQYYHFIQSSESFFVGSAKMIIEIEEKAPNKVSFKDASNKFIDVFRERLFGSPALATSDAPLQQTSIREIRNKISDLQNNVRQLDSQARNRLVGSEVYQDQRSQIKENMRSLQENINRLVDRSVGGTVGGYLARDMNSWVTNEEY